MLVRYTCTAALLLTLLTTQAQAWQAPAPPPPPPMPSGGAQRGAAAPLTFPSRTQATVSHGASEES